MMKFIHIVFGGFCTWMASIGFAQESGLPVWASATMIVMAAFLIVFIDRATDD